MKTIVDIQDFWYEVTQLTKKHSKGKHPKLRISSFGIFSSTNNSMVRKYFDLLQEFKYESVEIVIGMSKYNPCKKDCLDCYNKYCVSVQRVNKLGNYIQFDTK